MSLTILLAMAVLKKDFDIYLHSNSGAVLNAHIKI